MYQGASAIPRVDSRTRSSDSPETHKKVGLKRFFAKYFRQLFFVSFYFIWLFIFRWITKPQFLFFVYGTSGDKRAYWPKWLEKHLRPVFPVSLLYRKGSTGGRQWGWVVATPLSMEELERDDAKLLRRALDEIVTLFPSTKCCALAGRLPGILRKNRVVICPPFVDGGTGTRNTIQNAVERAALIKDVPINQLTVAVLGGNGYTGSKVVRDLSRIALRAIGIDPRYHMDPSMPNRDNQVFTSDASVVRRADIVVILTAQGDDASSAVPYFQPGTIVLDDTHPCVKRDVRQKIISTGAQLLKVSMNGNLNTFPRLPNFRSSDIPGCLAEAIGILLHGPDITNSLDDFSRATQHDLKVSLAPHPNDS